MASRSSGSAAGRSAASGSQTKTAMTAVKANVRWISMKQPSSRAGTLSENLMVASAFARSLRTLLSLLIAGGLASACRGADRVVAVNPVGRDIALAPETTLVAARVASGATFASLLRDQGMTAQESGDLIARAARVFDLPKVRAAQP